MDTIIKEALIDKIFKADSKKSIPQNIHVEWQQFF